MKPLQCRVRKLLQKGKCSNFHTDGKASPIKSPLNQLKNKRRANPSHLLKLDANQSQTSGALKLLWQRQLRYYYTMALKNSANLLLPVWETCISLFPPSNSCRPTHLHNNTTARRRATHTFISRNLELQSIKELVRTEND